MQNYVLKHNSKTLSITLDELIAKETKYSLSCHKDYTHPENQLAENNDPIKTDILKNVVKELLQRSNDKIVYLSEVKTRYMLYSESNDIDFKNAGKNLKRSIERNLSNIKLVTVNNKDIIYPNCLGFEDVLEIYLKTKEKLRKYENMNDVQQNDVSFAKCIRNKLQKSSYQISWPPKTDDLDVQTFPEFPLLQEFSVRLISNEPSLKCDRTKRMSLLFAQDLFFAAHNGEKLTLKNVLLLLQIKSLTNNTLN